MSKSIQMLFRCAFVLIVIVFGNYVIVAQTILTGDWRAEIKSEKNPDKIHLSFERRTDKGSNRNGSSYNYADWQGLTREQVFSGGAVKFSLVREAGTIECQGAFQNNKGAGTFQFTPNPQFVSAMKSRGFDFETESLRRKNQSRDLEDTLFAATTLNVTTALADDLLSADFNKLTVEDLFGAAIFNVNSQFIREMKASGFQNLQMEDLVKAKIFKINADFVRAIAAAGFDKEPFESLVKMRIFKVTPEFIAEARGEGLTNLNVEDLVKMKIFKIDAAFIRQAKTAGVPLEVEKLVRKRIGVWGR